MRIVSSWGMRLLAAYLILSGALAFARIPFGGVIAALLAIAAGVLILMGK